MIYFTVMEIKTQTKTCRRCNGRGTVANAFAGGICFGCEGTGVVKPVAPVVADARNWPADYAHGVAHRMDREFDRAARRAARSAS